MSTTNDAPIKSNQVPDNHTSEANNQAQLSIFAQIQSKIIDYIVLGIFAIIIILIIYYYVKKLMNSDTFQNAISGIKKGIDTLKGAVNRGTGKPLGCDIDETNRSGLCYKNCNSDEESDGTQRCYKNPPNWSNGAIWPGGKTITHLQHGTIYSPVGTTNTIPNDCTGTKQMNNGLCYDVPDGWIVTSPGFIGEKCENIQPGFTRDDGTGCWIDADTYGRGVGRDPGLGDCQSGWINDGLTCREPISCASGWDFFTKGCTGGAVVQRPANNCYGNEEKWGALCYPKCKSGYSPSGCCTCLRPANVKYRKIESRIGTLPDKCPGDKELHGRLCYPKCQDDANNKWPYERTDDNLEFCTTKCPNGWKNIGIGGCERPFRDVGMGVPIHVCPPGMENDAGLCYPPCDTLQEVKDKMAQDSNLKFKGVAATCFPML